MNTSLSPVSALSAEAAARLRHIYESGFAEHLRAPFTEAVASGRQDEEALALVDDDGAPLGLAVLRHLGDTRWTYLRYLVVDESQRGRGVGAALWRAMTSRLAAGGRSRLLWDVEDPEEDGVDEVEELVRRRRIRFYERQDGVLLQVEGYLTPHDTPGGRPQWDPMRLMTARLAPGEEAHLRDLVIAVYRHRWGLPEEHAVVASTLDRSGL
ncbi:GNAT family N-acetyltransferase [Actinoalloteichus caeruleus]|uniref:GNAT family N-acetyltransferase n=1 Tax=Actinoalloteichus cyanogriseus TaxID=2893586 RepID=UPI0004AB0F4C|nr:GNAT family N-acetyltransferase [Actinoalloteichus caeruleus]